MVGVEAFRTQHTALSAALRADVPFYALRTSDVPLYDARTGMLAARLREESYVVPLSLNVTMVFR
jgi:hypothetical protein